MTTIPAKAVEAAIDFVLASEVGTTVILAGEKVDGPLYVKGGVSVSAASAGGIQIRRAVIRGGIFGVDVLP